MNKSRLRAIVDTAVDGIILMDARGTVTMFNPACERIFGYAEEEIVGGDIKTTDALALSRRARSISRELPAYPGERKIIGIGREVVGRRKSWRYVSPGSVGPGRSRGGRRGFLRRHPARC